jgi:serine phosphatase RsbU (regulator of sigma subunit)
MVDPIRYRKTLVTLLKLLIVFELISALSEGLQAHNWSRFGLDLIVAGVLYIMWERIRLMLKTQKEEIRKKMERPTQDIRLLDAMLFSLLWSDQIFKGIPEDRRRLVVTSYTLITLGLVAAFVKVGTGLMPLVVAGALVLAAVNLVTWVVSLEREERETLKTELQLAHDVQVSLMPKGHPQVQGLDIAGMSVPAREVGGDFFDYSCLGGNDTKLGIPVFDVSGKGMQAAMSAVFTSGAFASEAQQSSSPAEILTRLNRSVCSHSRRGHFVAFLLVAVDQQTRSLTFANAGQTRPVLRSGGTVQSLDSVGVHFPLGMKEDSLYEERTVQLQPGDALFLLTDGFTDAMNSQDEMFGTERIERMLTDPRLDGLSAQQMMDFIADEVRTHVGSAPQHDDMTMVVVKVVAS